MKINTIGHYRYTHCLLMMALLMFTACQDDDMGAPAIEIRRITPESGVSGETIRLSGTGFSSGGKVVTFNGRRAIIASVEADTVINVTVPTDVTTGFIALQAGGQSATGPLFTVLRNPTPPEITSLSTMEAEVGEVFTITGKNFATGSDSALARNIVRVGGIRTQVVGGTSTALQVQMPSVAPGKHDLTVSVLAESSQALQISLKTFSGTLYWSDVPSTYWAQWATQQYIIAANADGTTRLIEKKLTAVPDYFKNGNYDAPAIVNGYNAATNSLYFLKKASDTGEPQIYKTTSPSWTDFAPIALANAPDIAAQGLNFSDVLMMGVSAGTQSFYSYNQNNNPQYPVRHIATGNVNDNSYRAFYHSTDAAYKPYGLFGYTAINGGAVSDTYFYAYEQKYGVTGRMSVEFTRIRLDETAPPEKITAVLTDEFVLDMEYHAPDGNLYVLTKSVVTYPNKPVYRLYRMAENDPSHFEPMTRIPYEPRSLSLLTTESGLKVYWIAKWTDDLDAVWMLNVKPGLPLNPFILYSQMQEISGKPETRILNLYFPGYLCPFLIVDDE